MNIAILAAGAGDMICGSCLRDSATAAALLRLGHKVSLVPLFTPVRTDGEDVSLPAVFYGGVNVYLQHASALFRHTPRMVDWLFDRPGLLRVAGNLGAQSTPNSVADLTVSVIEGSDGKTRKELSRLIAFLKREVQPQIVSLPNLMFIGAAAPLRKALNVPVVCELTGEDIFLDAMAESHRMRIGDMIRQRAGNVARFIATTGYYAGRMADYLGIAKDRIEVVPTGLSPEFFSPVTPRDTSTARPGIVGYLARICPEKGLDRLVEAMLLLRQKPGFENTRLIAAGYLGARDKKWFEALRQRIHATSLREAFTFLGEVDRAGKIKMLDSIDLLSVPTAYPESKGIYIHEALARGVPVVQPAHGSFPELVEKSGGGVLVPPGDHAALAEAIAGLLGDSTRRGELSRAGRAWAQASLTEDLMAARMLEIYQALL